MPDQLDWDDAEELGYLLAERFPDVDPLTVRFTDLLKWVGELPQFQGDTAKSNEGVLEAIQMAWHEEYQDRRQ
jgi:FeS assembly protein IscX